MTTSFRVVALIAARNENDVIGQVIEDLVTQGVGVYFIDDGSTDGTLDTVQSWTGRGVIGLERRPASATFNWTEILHRKEQLAAELEASWFIHHDADEFRQSPFPGKSLSEAIRIVDELGYNAIDFRVLNFRPTTVDRFDAAGDVRRALTHFEPAEYWETPQVKAWKKTGQVDLASSGGHDARFCGQSGVPGFSSSCATIQCGVRPRESAKSFRIANRASTTSNAMPDGTFNTIESCLASPCSGIQPR